MPTLEHDRLVFRFPKIEKEARFSIDFQRTLRIPDSDETYPLPPGLGRFPVRHAEDYPDHLQSETIERGGVILPIWQAEAMWLNFSNCGPDYGLDFPVAIKIAAGKINAVTGDTWRPGLHRDPQDYMVSPDQPWLDGFAIEKGTVRQFVAMPLGEGYTAEEQMTDEATWGGLQIQVVPMKAAAWQRKKAEWMRQRKEDHGRPDIVYSLCCDSMGMAPGGRMNQEIYEDPFSFDDWDLKAADRVFLTLIHAKDWKTITGEPAPNEPPTAEDYSRAGLPWFEYYGKDQTALPGSDKLANLNSLGKKFKGKTGADLPDSKDIKTGMVKPLGPGISAPRTVKTSLTWES